jgi:import inner membrane translocase subunit TIM44
LSDNQRKGFLGGFVDNLKEEFNKNKEMKDTIKKFREEAKKLEESDALKQAREKYVNK